MIMMYTADVYDNTSLSVFGYHLDAALGYFASLSASVVHVYATSLLLNSITIFTWSILSRKNGETPPRLSAGYHQRNKLIAAQQHYSHLHRSSLQLSPLACRFSFYTFKYKYRIVDRRGNIRVKRSPCFSIFLIRKKYYAKESHCQKKIQTRAWNAIDSSNRVHF